MKNAKKLFIAVLVVSMLASFNTLAFATNDDVSGGALLKENYEQKYDTAADVIASEADDKQKNKLVEIYNTLENQMAVSKTASLLGEEDRVYEDYYSGAYIDKGKLVVAVTDAFDGLSLKEAVAFTGDDDIELRIVKYSYNELTKAQSTIENQYKEYYHKYIDAQDSAEYDLLTTLAGFGIDEEYNGIIVDIVGLTDEKMNTFSNLFGRYDFIDFQEVGIGFEDEASYKPGRALYVITAQSGTNITYSRLSMGYRAYKTSSSGTKYGFATCGHGIKEAINSNVYSSTAFTTIIGTIIDWKYSGSVDASFIEVSSGNSIDTTAQYSNSSGSTSSGDSIATYYYMTNIPKGSTVYKVGSTTYRTSAEVTNTNYTFTVSGTTFTNLTKTDEFSDSGDSGGLVYMHFNDQYVPAGLIKGSGGIWLWSYSVYVKATEVVNDMSVYPY